MTLVESSKLKGKVEYLYKKLEPLISAKIKDYTFEHIGSTSIVGCLTKGDIDFYLEVEPEDHQNVIKKLLELGFKVKVDTHRDKSLCMLQNSECAIQVVSKGSKYEFFKVFRDKLNENPEMVSQYNQIKMSSQYLSDDDYRKNKAKFILSVL